MSLAASSPNELQYAQQFYLSPGQVHARMQDIAIRILDDTSSLECIGVHFRKPSDGPEKDLIDWFLGNRTFDFPAASKVTIFREPRLESGFPDIVLVVWRPSIARTWNEHRAKLKLCDIRMLQHLYRHGQTTISDLSQICSSNFEASIHRLCESEIIRQRRDVISPRSLTKNFAVERIIAIEAKMREWSNVMNQATLNTWFASESYVLVPHLPKSLSFEKDIISRGLGIWTKNDGCVRQPMVDSKNLPRSYASWLFNEWVWRADRLMSQCKEEY